MLPLWSTVRSTARLHNVMLPLWNTAPRACTMSTSARAAAGSAVHVAMAMSVKLRACAQSARREDARVSVDAGRTFHQTRRSGSLRFQGDTARRGQCHAPRQRAPVNPAASIALRSAGSTCGHVIANSRGVPIRERHKRMHSVE